MSTEKLVDKNMECIICLDLIDLEKQDNEIFKDCEHKNNYHEECINNWVNECVDQNICPSCPICRKGLEIIDNSLPEQNNQTRIIIHSDINPIQNRFRIIQTHSMNNFCCVCTLSVVFSVVIIQSFIQYIK